MNVSVIEVAPEYERLAIVVISPALNLARQNDRGVWSFRLKRRDTDAQGKSGRETVYLFDREGFRAIRKDIFLGNQKKLQARALGSGVGSLSRDTLVVKDREGKRMAVIRVEGLKEGTVEILFWHARSKETDERIILYAALLFASWVWISGTFGGINDFTQRIVFHEPKHFGYLWKAIRKHFARSLAVSLFFSVVMGAVFANIYFYIFLVASDVSVFIAAINVWMLLFFLLVLFWVYPLLVLSSDESIWKVMKKSLFVSFDNFVYTLRGLGIVIVMIAASAVTLFIFPGVSCFFGFINTALKEVSARYSKLDVV
jgi:hypothetical protein